MKKFILSILTLALATTASQSQELDRSVRPKPGPAPEIKLGKTESFTLDNGMRVFVVENHKLPTITCSIQLDVYPELEGDQAGYSTFLSELLTSGTKTRTKDEYNKEIDFIGANISANSNGVFGSSLKKHQKKLLELMSDVAMNAKFNAEDMEKVRKRTLSGLKASENDPDDMLNNVAAAVKYGTNHPYGEVVTDKTVEKATLASCEKYYQTYFRPNVAYMAVVGDVTVKEIKPLIEKYFGSWQKATVPVAKYAKVNTPSATNVAFVPRDAAVQSVINVTYPVDLQPGHADVVKAKVANAILGGGSTGRLFLNLREEHAWTYGSYSSISQDEIIGQFSAYAKCRNEVSDSSVAEILSEMKRMRNEKVSQEDLDRQISYMSGGFAIGLERPQTVAQYAINVERYNMPKDYYQNYLKNLSAVTVDDIQAIAKKYIDPSKAHIVVVGSVDEVADKLKRFDSDGKLDYYDNYGNKIEVAKKAAAPSDVTAEQIFSDYINAIGGEKTIASVLDVKSVSKGMLSVQGQEIPLTITEIKKSPNKLKTQVEAMGMVVQKQVFDGTTGYNEMQGQKADMDAATMKSAKQQADLHADLHPEKYGIKRTLDGMDKVNGSDAYVLIVEDGDGKKSKEYYDVKNHLLVKSISTEESPQGAITTTSEYSNYKEVPGTSYKIPYKVSQSFGPQSITAEVETIEINKGINDSEFK
ncbi:MAG: pitrilysin family protein [Flavipsychrobacter sp.]